MTTEVRNETDALEMCVDRNGLPAVLAMLATVCHEKADHIRASYDDKALAAAWGKAADMLSTLASTKTIGRIAP